MSAVSDAAPSWAVRLEDKIDGLRRDMSTGLDAVRSEVSQIRVDLARHETRVDALELRQRQIAARVDSVEDSVSAARGWVAGAIAASGLGGTAAGAWLLQHLGGAQ